jgi:hypothetical protein
VLRSHPAKAIPRTLPVTLNTADDHIRAIFARAGVGSRGDLMATVFRGSQHARAVAGDPARSPQSALAQGHHGPTQ